MILPPFLLSRSSFHILFLTMLVRNPVGVEMESVKRRLLLQQVHRYTAIPSPTVPSSMKAGVDVSSLAALIGCSPPSLMPVLFPSHLSTGSPGHMALPLLRSAAKSSLGTLVLTLLIIKCRPVGTQPWPFYYRIVIIKRNRREKSSY